MDTVAAFVFDMDGVLVDSERPSLALLERMLRSAGSHHDAATLRSVCGQPAAVLRRYAADHLGEGEHVDALIGAFDEAKGRMVAEGAIRAFPSTASVLAALRARGLRLAVATSTHAAEAHVRLERGDLARWFDVVVTGDEVAHGKPAPDIFLLAAARLDVPPTACVVVEDSRAGVAGARAAGMTVFALATTFPAADLGAADRVFDDMDDLHAFVAADGVGAVRGDDMPRGDPGVPGTRVRRATETDVPAIRAVLAATWRDTYGAFLPLEAIEQATAVWHAPNALTAELRSAATFTAVAEDDTGVVGMVTAHGRSEAVEIARLYVRPNAQRRGLGRALLAASLAAFPDHPTARLEVEAQNPKGRAFYAKEGFVEVGGRTVDVFGTHLRTIVMERVANPSRPPTGDGA